jgi:DNA-binding PadR family transcriptional regulator
MPARHLLTDFELMLVLAVLRVRGEAYGVRIAREIEAISGRQVMLGAAYVALDRLERNGMVTSEVGTSTAQRGGRARRIFSVTPRGLHAVRRTQKALVAMWRDVPELRPREARS